MNSIKKIRCFLNILMTLALACVGLLNILYKASVSYDMYEITSFKFLPQYFIYAFFFGIFLLLFLLIIMKFTEKQLFIICSVFYMFLIIYCLLNVKNPLRADQKFVYDAALQLMNGDFSSLEKSNYLYTYPNQLGLTAYDILLSLFSKNFEIIYLVNGIEILIINWTGYKITDCIFHNTATNKILISLEFMFLPQFFYMLFAYGLIPGFCCIMIAFYCTLMLIQKGTAKYGIVTIIFVFLACILKSNYQIGGIAVFIILTLHFFNDKKRRHLLIAMIVLILSLTSGKIVATIYHSVTDMPQNSGVSSLLWIAMGTDLDNNLRAPGWYNQYNYNTYIDTDCDSEKSSKIARNKIQDNIVSSVKNPIKTVKFYTKKIVSMWCDPLFQSIWIGPIENTKDDVHSTFFLSLYERGIVNRSINRYMKCFVIIIFLSACYFRYKYRQNNSDLLYLYFLGGFVFHIFWEGKSQYIYPYVFVLLPGCAYVLSKLTDILIKKKYKIS